MQVCATLMSKLNLKNMKKTLWNIQKNGLIRNTQLVRVDIIISLYFRTIFWLLGDLAVLVLALEFADSLAGSYYMKKKIVFTQCQCLGISN